MPSRFSFLRDRLSYPMRMEHGMTRSAVSKLQVFAVKAQNGLMKGYVSGRPPPPHR